MKCLGGCLCFLNTCLRVPPFSLTLLLLRVKAIACKPCSGESRVSMVQLTRDKLHHLHHHSTLSSHVRVQQISVSNVLPPPSQAFFFFCSLVDLFHDKIQRTMKCNEGVDEPVSFCRESKVGRTGQLALLSCLLFNLGPDQPVEPYLHNQFPFPPSFIHSPFLLLHYYSSRPNPIKKGAVADESEEEQEELINRSSF